MATYQTPGVYVVEDDSAPIVLSGVPTGIPCLFGFTEQGPSGTPTRITSLNEFYSLFGRKADESVFPHQFMADAVHGFFLNGGNVCYVCRVNKGHVARWPIRWIENVVDLAAIRDESQADVTPAKPRLTSFNVEAISPGTWGNAIRIHCRAAQDAGLPAPHQTGDVPIDLKDKVTRFDLTVQRVVPGAAPGDTDIEPLETFADLSTDPDDPRYYLREGLVNGTSSYVKLRPYDGAVAPDIGFGKTQGTMEVPTDATVLQPTDDTGAPPATSAQGTDEQPAPKDYEALFATLKGNADVSILACPDAFPEGHRTPEGSYRAIFQAAIGYASAHRCMVVIDTKPEDPDTTKTDRAALTALANKQREFADNYRSSYAAIYTPWVTTANLDESSRKRTKLVPPSGLILGAYARSDSADGVWKAPANLPLVGPVELQIPYTDEQNEVLNPAGVNVIRNFPGHGILIWGARTTATEVMWQYVNVRRILLYVERTLRQQMTAVVFETNDERTWSSVTLTIEAFLREFWQEGGLMGTTQEEAFRVQCGMPQTMTSLDVAAGLLKVEIAIAPVRPAEFIVFTSSQLLQSAIPEDPET